MKTDSLKSEVENVFFESAEVPAQSVEGKQFIEATKRHWATSEKIKESVDVSGVGLLRDSPDSLYKELLNFSFGGDVKVVDDTWLVLVWKVQGASARLAVERVFHEIADAWQLKKSWKCESDYTLESGELIWSFSFEWMVGVVRS